MVSCWLIKNGAGVYFAKGNRLIAVHAEDQARINSGGRNSPESMIHLFTQIQDNRFWLPNWL